MRVQRGDIYFADLNPTVGSEQAGQKPVLIIQNNIGNTYSPTVIVAVIQSKATRNNLPTHVEVEYTEFGKLKSAVVALEQIRTLDKSRLIQKIGIIDSISLERVNEAIRVSLSIIDQAGEILH